MSFTRKNLLDLALDIAGSLVRDDEMIIADENLGIGRQLRVGSGASVAVSGGVVTISGLNTMSGHQPGEFLKVYNGNGLFNDGYGPFMITAINSGSEVVVSDPNADLSNGWSSLDWTVHQAYSAEDDLNYARTDRKAIKGTTNYYDPIPTHTNPKGEVLTLSLANLAGKTIDAKGFVLPRMILNRSVAANDTSHTLTDANPAQFKHSDNSDDRTGVPTMDFNSDGYQACFVEILDSETENEIVSSDGKKVFGVTVAGANSSGSVDVVFKKVAFGADLSTSVDYTWEAGKPTNVMMSYGYYQVIEEMDEDAFRKVQVLGLASDGDLRADINDLQSAIGMNDGDTNIGGHLDTTGTNFAFSTISGTATVVDALNELNSQLGDFTFTNTQFISDGYTVAENLEALADAVVASQIIRVINRLSADVTAGTALEIDGIHDYVVDNTGNGNNLWVFTRGLLRSPGAITEGNDYLESSTTEVTFHMTLRAGDHVNFFLRNHNA